jgi:hypothetical protein
MLSAFTDGNARGRTKSCAVKKGRSTIAEASVEQDPWRERMNWDQRDKQPPSLRGPMAALWLAATEASVDASA